VQTSRIGEGNHVIVARRGASAVFAALVIGLLTGASCDKKDDPGPVARPDEVLAAADSAGKPATLDRTPVPNIDVSRLPPDRQELFFRLMADLPSPCGKAHSLRTSVTQDPGCKRAPFASRLVAELIVDEAGPDDVREFYQERYGKGGEPKTFDLATAPGSGAPTAAITMVEFFDYGCPSCVQLKPVLDEVVKANQPRLKVHYKMYPLPSHPDSFGAAQAALAGHAQGKFHEMHDKIFAKFGAQKKADLRHYAEELGLDMARYDADFVAAEAKVKADMAEGTAKGVTGTPTLFIDGRLYPGPYAPKYMGMAIDEAMALKN
jgi:protein-disulfide isomerase